MTKQELAQKVAAATGLSGSDAKSVVDATFDAIAQELIDGGEVAVAGFGRFSVADRSAREARNPSTGETFQVAASKAAKFSAASALKATLALPYDERRSDRHGATRTARSESSRPGPRYVAQKVPRPPVFVSYSHEDEASARRLKDAFARHGLRAWVATDDILPGEKVSEAVGASMSNASVLVLVIGQRQSNWARYEWRQALLASWERGVPLLPVLLEGAEPPAFLRDQPVLAATGAPADWDEIASRVDRARTSGRQAPAETQRILDGRLTEIQKAAAALPGRPLEQG